MKDFWDWLCDEAEKQRILFWFFMILLNCLSFSYIISFLCFFMNIELPPRFIRINMIHWPNYLIFLFFFGLLIAEELIFHTIPFYFSVKFFKKPWLMFLVLVISSATFGFIHGGFTPIFAQGITGFLIGILYLKCGGAKGKIIKPTIIAIFTHYLFNEILVSLDYLIQHFA